MATHNVDNRWLPTELHNTIWSDLNDTTALEPGDWVFDPERGAHYAGQVQKTSEAHREAGLIDIMWHKSPDNIFPSFISHSQATRLWWIDPCANSEEGN